MDFPFMSDDRFRAAGDALVRLFERCGHEQHDWCHVALAAAAGNQAWLRIRRRLAHTSLPTAPHMEMDEWCDLAEESDEEALPHEPRTEQSACVEYSVLLSPTYRVPVLYLMPQGLAANSHMPIDDLQQLVVAPQFRAQVESVGVMGGISMTNHPVTDMPVLFVHPCNTASALQEATPSRELTPLQYLQLWLGIIGGCVGLQMPVALASQIDVPSP